MSGRKGRVRGQGSATTTNQDPPTAVAAVPIQQQPNLADLYKNFLRLGGKPFTGKETIVEAQAWIRSCEKIFRGLKLQDDQKRLIASWQLQREALAWWETVIVDRQEDEFTWGKFKEVFEKRYLPSAEISGMYQEFMDLKQGSLSFEEYLNKFNELSRFGPELVNTPLKKNERFIRGMNKKFHERTTGHVKESFLDLVDMGYRYTTLDMQEAPAEKGNSGNQN